MTGLTEAAFLYCENKTVCLAYSTTRDPIFGLRDSSIEAYASVHYACHGDPRGGVPKEVRELMGEDFWPYGIEPNRKTIEMFLRYAREQGLTASLLKPEDLFAKETIDTFRV
jgi:hypothetical protein